MNKGTRFVAVLFAPGGRADRHALAAPGHADCRWRAAAALERAVAVNDARVEGPAPTADDGGSSDALDR